MKFWTIDTETREVIGSGDADKWNVPRNALLDDPLPEKEGFAVVAKADLSGTEYVADYRGKTIYSTGEVYQSKVVKDLGEIEAGWTLTKRPPYSVWQNNDWVQQIALLQEAKHAEVNQWRSQQEADTSTIVEANGHRWDAGPEARARIDSTLLTEQMPPYWTDADNVDHQGMTLDELKAVKVAISELGFQIHHRQRTMKKDIELISDFAELEKYPIGWPTPPEN